MSRLIVTCLAAFLVVGPGRMPAADKATTDWQKKADAAEWKWSDDHASLRHCVQSQLRGYEAEVYSPKGREWWEPPFEVDVTARGKLVCCFRAHDATVFTQLGDVLYVADFSPICTGCSLEAYDLKGRKLLWRCRLKGNPPPGHSKYHHRVNITTQEGMVVVYGNEDNGRYIEYVDPRTGATVGHKKFPPEP
jgi:hypothetical protein